MRERMAAVHVCDVWALPPVRTRLGVTVTRTVVAGERLPGGVVAHVVEGVEPGEAALWIPSRRALFFGDSVMGTGSGVAVSPRSWAPEGEAAGRLYERTFRASLRRLLDLPVETLIPSHGPPVLTGGREALAGPVAAHRPLAAPCPHLSPLSPQATWRYHLRQEPDAGKPLVRICGGGRGQP